MASRATRMKVNLDTSRRCTTQKRGYTTKAAALDGAERLMELGRVKPGCHITPYECRYCGQWHVTNRVIVWLPKDQRAEAADER